MESAGLATSGRDGAAPRIPFFGEGGKTKRGEPQKHPPEAAPSCWGARGLTLFSSDGPVEQGVEQELERSGVAQTVEDLEDVGFGEEPLPPVQSLEK